MSRVEIVHLRSSGEPLDALGRHLAESITPASDVEAVALYRRQGLETDLAVHIHHSAAARGQGASDLALRLAAALTAYGLVELTVWEELP